MTTTALKKKIHEYIESTDDKILKVVHTILAEHNKLKTRNISGLTEKDIIELDRRWDKFKKGKSKTYTLEEVKAELHQKIKVHKG